MIWPVQIILIRKRSPEFRLMIELDMNQCIIWGFKTVEPKNRRTFYFPKKPSNFKETVELLFKNFRALRARISTVFVFPNALERDFSGASRRFFLDIIIIYRNRRFADTD